MSSRAVTVCTLFWLAIAGAVVCAAGCGKLLGIEDTSPAEEPVDPLICADLGISSALDPSPIDTETATDDFVTSCGDSGARDQAFAFTAPVTDYYVFDTFGAGFDTVLALYDGCSGNELACSNNVGAMPQSELVRKLDEGQKALVVVEGFAGDSGKGNLQVARVSCPDADLEAQSLPVELTTVSFGDDFQGACGGQGHEDRGYHWVAPRDGIYAFRVTSSSFTPAISLIDGPRCSDASLGCNAAAPGIGHAEVVRRLHAGQPVGITVDGTDGAGVFSIDITERAGTCPEGKLVANTGLAGEQFTDRILAPSCSPVEVSGMFGGRFDLPDKSYSFEVPSAGQDCFTGCDVSVTSSEPVTLYVLQGNDCSGTEMACKPSQLTGGQHTASLSLNGGPTGPTPYTIVVAEGLAGGQSTFDIQTQCFLACP